jgi:hypothetical protein
MAQVGREVDRADTNRILRHGGPNPGATKSEIAKLEEVLGFPLPASYKEFLTYSNGWIGFFESTDMFSIADLRDERAVEAAWVVAEAMDEGIGGSFGLSRDRYLPIGSSAVNLSIVLLGREPEAGIRGVVQAGVEEFATFEAFLGASIRYLRDTLDALLGDPWFGIPGANSGHSP